MRLQVALVQNSCIADRSGGGVAIAEGQGRHLWFLPWAFRNDKHAVLHDESGNTDLALRNLVPLGETTKVDTSQIRNNTLE